MYYAEHCRTVNDRHGNVKPVHQIVGQQGYISVFRFSEIDAEIIRAQGHSRGLDRFKVGSEVLYLDFDDGDVSAAEASEWLVNQKVTHWVYASGGKGCHVLARCEPGYSHVLPQQHAILAGVVDARHDPSLYTHGHLVRLPGTVHEKTGNKKELLWKYEGDQVLPLPPEPVYVPKEEILITDKDALYFMFRALSQALETDTKPGNRHSILWRIPVDCRRAGISYAACREIMHAVNAHFLPPKDAAEVDAVLESGYR